MGSHDKAKCLGMGAAWSSHEAVGDTQGVSTEEDLAGLGSRSRFVISGKLNAPRKLLLLSRLSFPSSKHSQTHFLCIFPPETFFQRLQCIHF